MSEFLAVIFWCIILILAGLGLSVVVDSINPRKHYVACDASFYDDTGAKRGTVRTTCLVDGLG